VKCHLLLFALCGCVSAGPTVDVATSDALRQALQEAKPGTTIRLSPGTYPGGFYAAQLHGTADQPIVITARNPEQPPLFDGGNGCHIAGASYLTIEHLRLRGAKANGLNLDDGGQAGSSHHITVRHLTITDVGPQGNRDGLKLSGLDDFRVEGCTFERWGDGGSGIDMVGCHRGVIVDSSFSHPGTLGNGVQAKGGSSEVVIRNCFFDRAGSRQVQLGGSTGLQFFRPLGATYEARDLTVEGCVFTGCMADLAFVGVDGATVRYNTFYQPEKWLLRILQETREPQFVPCRNGVFERNLIVYRTDRWAENGVNIGPGTAPETFVFRDNLWFATDRPERSRPRLPSEETGGVYGQDPRLTDPQQGDFRPAADGPGAGHGFTALPAE